MFITFEGIDGAGKSVQLELARDALDRTGYKVIVTREPGGTGLGERLRDILLNSDVEKSARADVLLFNAARAQLVEDVIRPALERKSIVLCDRFVDSTIAYQGYGRGEDVDELRRICDYATGGLVPDLTIYQSVRIGMALRRVWSRDHSGDRPWTSPPADEVAFYEPIVAGYGDMIANEFGSRWFVVDSHMSKKVIHEMIMSEINKRLFNAGWRRPSAPMQSV